eukprot:CAMPEP_0171982394 /NCGR_PEP_ID=MMETSP0993-20121228/271054_1 /TAXON_ID=483369 /ORGANISM="non described non described, Strain CCMP2098" /LENGTH=88 /DNA_ID=CAMNT_0012634999 /DNA_START=23 /DNA_END=286 /DNA_ORIENTATION=-
MSLHNRHSLNSGRESEGRVSLNSADISNLPDEDFRARPSSDKIPLRTTEDGDNPLNNSLLSAEGLIAGDSISDPTANPSTLLEQTWAT